MEIMETHYDPYTTGYSDFPWGYFKVVLQASRAGISQMAATKRCVDTNPQYHEGLALQCRFKSHEGGTAFVGTADPHI